MMNHHILIQAYFSNYFRVHLNNKHVHAEIILTSYAYTPVTLTHRRAACAMTPVLKRTLANVLAHALLVFPGQIVWPLSPASWRLGMIEQPV